MNENLNAQLAKSYAGIMLSCSTDMEKTLNDATILMDEVAKIWDSPKAKEYRTKYDEVAQVYPTVKKFVENLSVKVETSVKNFEINE